MTECTQPAIELQGPGRRKIRVDFQGGNVSSEGGGLLLREVERQRGWIRGLAECCTDTRNPAWVEHPIDSLLAQRIFGLALGYEDLNDHEHLRTDPLLAVLCDKGDPLGQGRRRKEDQGKPLAGKSTLNRMELGGQDSACRYKKVEFDEAAIADLFVRQFISGHTTAPASVILDVDATDDVLHGKQEGRFFHGYYDAYCYLPLYIFCGDQLLCARLRPSNIDASAGALDEIERIVEHLREAWPEVKILVRGDSGFARDEIMSWCEEHRVDYLFGLARNARLERLLSPALESAKRWQQVVGGSVRTFMALRYRTQKTWSRVRRVIGKAEVSAQGSNPRFVVTSLTAREVGARELYEQMYCARGEMENRIKEQQLDLFADRTSTAAMKSNQLRLWFSAIAYSLINDLRTLGLKGTRMARSTCGTIRERLLKIGAVIRVSVRRVVIHLATGCAWQDVFTQAFHRLCPACINTS